VGSPEILNLINMKYREQEAMAREINRIIFLGLHCLIILVIEVMDFFLEIITKGIVPKNLCDRRG
jgi:hypothetical protein